MTEPNASPAPRPRALIESALATAIDRVGPVLFFDAPRLRSLLREATTDAPKEIEMVIAALGEEVPQNLLAANGDHELRELMPRLVQKVMTNRKVDRGPALWSVRTWAHALALPTTVLDGTATAAATPAPLAPPEGMDLSAFGKSRAEAPASRRPPVPVPMPTPAVVPPVVQPLAPAARVEPTWAAPVAAPEQPVRDRADELSDFIPLDIPERFDEAAPAVAAVPELVPGTIGDASATMAAAIDASTPRHDEPASAPLASAPIVAIAATDPTPPRDEPVVFAPAEPVAIAPAEPTVAPRVEPMRAPEVRMREPVADEAPGLMRPRNLVIAAVLLVLVIAGAFAAWMTGSTTDAPKASAAGKLVIPPTPEPPAATTPPAATEPAPTPIATTNGTTASPPVASTETPKPAEASSSTASEPAASATTAASSSQASASTSASTPASTAAMREAEPSTSREKAVAGTGPSITRIDVPTMPPGRAFSVALAVDGDPARVASIERHVVTSDTTWPSDTVTTSVKGLVRLKSSGGFMVPFKPVPKASTTTFEFVAIDRRGARGPGRRATLTIAEGATSVAAAPKPADATPAAAPASTAVPAAPAECAPYACGVVVSQREIELKTGTPSYETIVRMDDRSIQNVTQATKWTVGTRVRLSGDRVSALDR